MATLAFFSNLTGNALNHCRLSDITPRMRDQVTYLVRRDEAQRAADLATDSKMKTDWEAVADQWAKLATQAGDLDRYDKRAPEPKSWVESA